MKLVTGKVLAVFSATLVTVSLAAEDRMPPCQPPR